MWFLARDRAFEKRGTDDIRATLLKEMGIFPRTDSASGIERRKRERRLCKDLDPDLDLLLERLTKVLCVELAASRQFAWAEEFLSNTKLVGGNGEAARIVGYIRQDETPHVAYLVTVLSEMEELTFIGESGSGGRRRARTGRDRSGGPCSPLCDPGRNGSGPKSKRKS
jgi:hypothetical protein